MSLDQVRRVVGRGLRQVLIALSAFRDNPVVTFELLAWLRTGRAMWLQMLFLAVSVAALLVVWPSQQAGPLQVVERARVVEATLFWVQYVLAALVIPVVAAPAFAGERERGTYDLLVVTPIEPSRLVVGKLGSTLAYVLLLICSTLPVGSVATYLGGVRVQDLAVDYLALVACATIFAALQLVASATQRRTAAALVVGYAAVLLLSVTLGLVVGWRGRWEGSGAVGSLALSWLLVLAVGSVAVAFCFLQRRVLRPPDRDITGVPADEEKEKKNAVGLVLDRRLFPDRWLLPPRRDSCMPDGVNPVLDREMRAEIVSQGTFMLRALIQVSCAVSVPLMVLFLMMFPNLSYAYVWFVLAFVMLVGPIFSAHGIAQEYERGTMDLLRCTLLKPREVLLGKALASLRVNTFLVGMLTVVQMGVPAACLASFVGGRALALYGCYAVLVLALIPAVIAVALAWSSLLRRTLAAQLATYATLVLLFVAPAATARWLTRENSALRDAADLFSPFAVVFRLPTLDREVYLWGLTSDQMAPHLGTVLWLLAGCTGSCVIVTLVGGSVALRTLARRWYKE